MKQDGTGSKDNSNAVTLYGLSTVLVEQARRIGQDGFAAVIERAMDGLLTSMPKTQRKHALLLACELAKPEPAAQAEPHLRLVVSQSKRA